MIYLRYFVVWSKLALLTLIFQSGDVYSHVAGNTVVSTQGCQFFFRDTPGQIKDILSNGGGRSIVHRGGRGTISQCPSPATGVGVSV